MPGTSISLGALLVHHLGFPGGLQALNFDSQDVLAVSSVRAL